MRNKVLVLVTLMLSSSHGYVSAYHVEPVKALLSGWSPLYENVTQTVTCNFDSLSYVELFCGAIADSGTYNLDVRDGETGDRVAYKYDVRQNRDHGWVRFDTLAIVGPFTKGKTYEVRFTRSGSDSGV